ncbi:unnamed protein product [Lathyrus sativus]|nr:unnamed protein product [Lathyrus sativus]
MRFVAGYRGQQVDAEGLTCTRFWSRSYVESFSIQLIILEASNLDVVWFVYLLSMFIKRYTTAGLWYRLVGPCAKVLECSRKKVAGLEQAAVKSAWLYTLVM